MWNTNSLKSLFFSLFTLSEFHELNKKSKGDWFEVSCVSDAIGEFNIWDFLHCQSSAAIVFDKANASDFHSNGSVLFQCTLSCQCSADVTDPPKFWNKASKVRSIGKTTGSCLYSWNHYHQESQCEIHFLLWCYRLWRNMVVGIVLYPNHRFKDSTFNDRLPIACLDRRLR